MDKIEFPGQTINSCPQHVLHILKATDLTVHFSYQETFFEHPTRRHIFAYTVGRVCKLDLTLRRMVEPADIYREETDTEQPRQSSTNVSQEFSHLISFNFSFCYHMFAV